RQADGRGEVVPPAGRRGAAAPATGGGLVPEIHQPDERDVRELRQRVEHAVGQGLIHRDGRERVVPWEGDAGLVVAADVDPGPAQQRADTTDDSGHVAIPDHQHPPIGRHVDLVVVDPTYAAVIVPHHRGGHPGPAALRIDRHSTCGLYARPRDSGVTRVA